ncbi:MAG TPA: ABC transporter ATP-binding protein [Firmicutes bacterium]|nr:ABC transporter ATP-binding protein [Candidatus Fermentithermobacillaceae bacterium]
MVLIEVLSLSKNFGEQTVLRDITFSVAPSTMTFLLGPNGAGKTTLIRLLCGLLEPSSGSFKIAGIDSSRIADIKRVVGVVLPGERNLYWKLTGEENLEFFGSLYGLWGRKLAVRIAEVVELTGIEEFYRTPVERYSTGMRQRLSLARALLHEPKVLLMDEPTSGMDPIAKHQMEELLRKLARNGVTLLISTHDMPQVERLADQVLIIDAGRIVAQGSPAELIAEMGQKALIRFVLDGPPDEVVHAISQQQLGPVDVLEGEVRLWSSSPDETIGELFAILRQTSTQLLRMEVTKPGLDGVFWRATGRYWELDRGGPE